MDPEMMRVHLPASAKLPWVCVPAVLTIMLPIEVWVTLRNVKEVPMTEMIPVPYMNLPFVPGMLHPNTCSNSSFGFVLDLWRTRTEHM